MMEPLFKAAVLLRALTFLIWTLFSAWLFSVVEQTGMDNTEEKYKLFLSLYNSMASKYNMTVHEFINFSSAAYEALSEPKPQWNYYDAIDFTFHVFTTIGYGYITPRTPAGQILCIIVSLVGIPITLLTLKSIGELISKGVDKIVMKFEKKILKRSEVKHVKSKSAMILFTLVILLIVLNELAIVRRLDWTLVEGVYFWFITFSTIGFGDYVLRPPQRIRLLFTDLSANKSVRQENMHLSVEAKSTSLKGKRLLFMLYYILSLCIISSVINSIIAVFEERKCRRQCPECVPRDIQERVYNIKTEKTKDFEPVVLTHFSIHMDNVQSQKECIDGVINSVSDLN